MSQAREPAEATTVGDCLRAYALREIETAGRMLGRQGPALHNGVHEARKAIRHVRSTLRLGATDLGDDGTAVAHGLKELAETLSSIRDAHVAVQTLRALAATNAEPHEHRLLVRAGRVFSAHRTRQLAALVLDDPGLLRRRATLRQLRERLAALPWSALPARSVHAALAQSMRRGWRLGRRAHDSRNGELRHRWRRRLRRLRHQLKIVESELGWLLSTRESWSWPDPASDVPDATVVVAVMPKTLGAITDRLGFEHDLRMLRSAMKDAARLTTTERKALRALLERAIETALT